MRKPARIRDLLNMLKWKPGEGLGNYEIVVVHRGAPGDAKVIDGSTVVDVARRALVYLDEGEETVVPFHRVIEVRLKSTKEVVWRRLKVGGEPLR